MSWPSKDNPHTWPHAGQILISPHPAVTRLPGFLPEKYRDTSVLWGQRGHQADSGYQRVPRAFFWLSLTEPGTPRGGDDMPHLESHLGTANKIHASYPWPPGG